MPDDMARLQEIEFQKDIARGWAKRAEAAEAREQLKDKEIKEADEALGQAVNMANDFAAEIVKQAAEIERLTQNVIDCNERSRNLADKCVELEAHSPSKEPQECEACGEPVTEAEIAAGLWCYGDHHGPPPAEHSPSKEGKADV